MLVEEHKNCSALLRTRTILPAIGRAKGQAEIDLGVNGEHKVLCEAFLNREYFSNSLRRDNHTNISGWMGALSKR